MFDGPETPDLRQTCPFEVLGNQQKAFVETRSAFFKAIKGIFNKNALGASSLQGRLIKSFSTVVRIPDGRGRLPSSDVLPTYGAVADSLIFPEPPELRRSPG